MKMLHYILIPIAVILTAFIGGQITNVGMSWYKTINLPSWTPPGSIIGTVWTVIFILTAISAIIYWNKVPIGNMFYWILGFFVVNLLLNILWSFLFFGVHYLGWAVIEALVLDLSVIILMVLIFPFSKLASLLLFPYAFWVAFASYLTYSVWFLNRA
jgi:benzodiazapine receptor